MIQSNKTKSIRWGGAFITIGSLTMLFSIISYIIFYGQPAGTGSNGQVTLQDTANHILNHWNLVSNIWRAEGLSTILIAIAGFALIEKPSASHDKAPIHISWISIGVGSILLTTMYAYMIGTFRIAATNLQISPSLLPAMNESAKFIFYLGNLVFHLGFIGIFLNEISDKFIPSWIAFIGLGLNIIAAAIMLLLLFGIVDFSKLFFAGPLVGLIYIIIAYYGFSIWKKSLTRD